MILPQSAALALAELCPPSSQPLWELSLCITPNPRLPGQRALAQQDTLSEISCYLPAQVSPGRGELWLQTVRAHLSAIPLHLGAA